MSQYRCYFLDGNNHVISFLILDFPTDALARAEADKLWKSSPHHGVEIWNGAQMVHHEMVAV